MDELKRNGSGYYDPTAYEALKKFPNGGATMGIKAGEIWEINCGSNYMKMCIVLKVFSKFCLVLALNDERKSEDDIEVIAKGLKYTTPYMISYRFERDFMNFVKSMKDDEFETLMDVVEASLGFGYAGDSFEEAAHEMVNDLEMQLEESRKLLLIEKEYSHDLKKKITDLEKQLEKAENNKVSAMEAMNHARMEMNRLEDELEELKNQPIFSPDPEEVVKLKAQIEMLERQNERLLDRLIG